MGLDSIWHWLILLVIVLAVFGTSKLTKMGPDLGNALREFKKALNGDDEKDKDHASSEDGRDSLKADPPASDASHKQESHDSNASK